MESYTIRKHDGKLEGPYSLRVIKAFVIAGKLTAEDFLITPEGECPLSTHDDLRVLWEPESANLDVSELELPEEVGLPLDGRIVFYRGKVLPPNSKPDFAGKLDRFSLVHLLYRMHLHHATCRIFVHHGNSTLNIFLEHGVPCHVASNDEDTRLGEILVRESLLTRDTVHHALELSEAQERPLGQILLEEQLLSGEQIQRALTYQMKRRLFAPLGWSTNTHYRVYLGQITGAQFPVKVDFYKLLQEAAFEWVPRSLIKERLLQQLHRRVARTKHPKLSLENFDLDTNERRLYQTILNRDPLNDVLGEAIESDMLSEEQASRVVFLLWQVDLLSVNEEVIGTRTQRVLDELNSYIHQLQNQSRLQRLGLKGGANPSEIRQAYLNLAREYHPDLLPPGTHPEVSRKMSEAFALVADAYSVLTG